MDLVRAGKTGWLNQFYRRFILISAGIFLPLCSFSQVFTTLHSFSGSPGDGANPVAGLALSSNMLYGVAQYGGAAGNGAVFALKTDGTIYTNIHSFTGLSGGYPAVNSDGANPCGTLVASSNVLYGTASLGGEGGYGTVFQLNTDGLGFLTLHSFPEEYNNYPYGNSDGAVPLGGLALSGGIVYGTAYIGGTAPNNQLSDFGSVYTVNPVTLAFTNLHSFAQADGARPSCAPVYSGGRLYGTTQDTYPNTTGNLCAVFAIDSDGGGFNDLRLLATNEGSDLNAGLILSGNTLYGTAKGGGMGYGTVFGIGNHGSNFVDIHEFTGGSDGASPLGNLLLIGNTLFGTASAGGAFGQGSVFAVNTAGSGFTNLHSFSALSNGTNCDGATPSAGLVVSNYVLYGTTQYGGASGDGTVFGISFAPSLTIQLYGANLLIQWPMSNAGFDYTGFNLQSSINPASALSWINVTPAPSVGGNFVIWTNPVPAQPTFYRLAK